MDLRRASILLLLAAPALGFEGTTYDSAAHGFSILVREGWTHREEAPVGEDVLHLVIAPARAAERVRLSVRVLRIGARRGPEDAQDEAMRLLRESPSRYSDVARTTRELLGKSAPGIITTVGQGAGAIELQQRYAVAGDRLFVLQTSVPASERETWSQETERMLASFALRPVSEEATIRRRLEALADRCGSEIDWAADWKDAAARARKERKLVLVSIFALPGFQLPDSNLRGPFMDPDVIELVKERYVPLRYRAGGGAPFDDPAVYGLGRSTFGSDLLLVAPDGRVVRHGATAAAAYDYLREGCAADARFPGSPAPRSGDPIERASILARRGDLAEAAALLAGAASAESLRLRASIHRRLRRGAEALADLASARGAAGGSEIAADLDVEEAVLLARTGRADEAMDLLGRFVERTPSHARLPEALFALGTLRFARDGASAAEPTWRRLADEHPESRWAWRAAAALTSAAFQLGAAARIEWPEEEWFDLARHRAPAALPLAKAREAADGALSWLLRHQRADGSWASLTQMGRVPEEAPDDFTLATTALAAIALLPRRAEPGVADALERALAWIESGARRAHEAGDRAHFMDYAPWSRAYVVACLAEAVTAGLRTRESVAEAVRDAIDDLAVRRKPGGGFGYYVTGDLAAKGAPSAVAMSFTTAAVVGGLLRARDAGLEPPEGLIAGALDALEGMRARDGSFRYSATGASRDEPPQGAGAAGRGPACALALLRGGRSSADDVAACLDRFVDHRASYAREVGKALMHAGPEAQGSHYLLFDYANAAAAITTLPKHRRESYRRAVLEEVLRARRDDGSFVDNPIDGSGSGTALALLALDVLAP